MPLYKPSELRQFLDEIGASPKKGLSQNFLIDGNIIRKIVASAEVSPGDVVLEIGPGPGALTEALLDAGARVIAVEKDHVLAEALKRLDGGRNLLHVFCEDILSFPIQATLAQFLSKGQKAKVIANLPYHLTTPILTTLIPMESVFKSVTVMVQDEVARRYTAQEGNKEYGAISVFLNFYTTPRYCFTVGKKCFYPSPKVNSAIVAFELRIPPLDSDAAAFFELTRTAFKQRRKMLKTSLHALYPSDEIAKALEQCGCSPLARPENLSLDKFLKLYDLIKVKKIL